MMQEGGHTVTSNSSVIHRLPVSGGAASGGTVGWGPPSPEGGPPAWGRGVCCYVYVFPNLSVVQGASSFICSKSLAQSHPIEQGEQGSSADSHEVPPRVRSVGKSTVMRLIQGQAVETDTWVGVCISGVQGWAQAGCSVAQVKIFAPNIEQRDVVNHLKGSPTEEKRNVLVESARLARGNIQDLAELKAGEFDAVIFPGGFGVAKNLCSWAVDGKNCTVNEQVSSTLQAFHSAKKPIGLCCISPVLAAKVFPGCEVTVGQDKDVDGRFPDAETASAIAELGCKHICKNVNESHVDKANKIVTTCAFMCKAPLHEIFDGIGTMVQEVLKLA
ncbi:PREDICTED: ES1 protein homolog, mitochondrial-like [Nipponia nippon]|nr:PREDICTED: ES1 protein homolog, mitochondrial-like [Nipponia nippon]